MGYNEISKLKIIDPNNLTKKIETTNKQKILETTKSFYQKIYNEQKHVTPAQNEINNLLQMDNGKPTLEKDPRRNGKIYGMGPYYRRIK